MGSYAAKTEVPVEKTRAEIEATVRRYKADGFISGWEGAKAMVQFRLSDRYIRFTMSLPEAGEKRFTEYKQGSSTFARKDSAALALWEQACRQKWRALALVIKANLEAVEAGIMTFEQAFLPHVVMPDGRTVYEMTKEPIRIAYAEGKHPPLLGYEEQRP